MILLVQLILEFGLTSSIFSPLCQHHCRSCGRTLCSEHSSNQMVGLFPFCPASFIVLHRILPIACDLSLHEFRPYHNLAFTRLLEFVSTALTIPLGKSCYWIWSDFFFCLSLMKVIGNWIPSERWKIMYKYIMISL